MLRNEAAPPTSHSAGLPSRPQTHVSGCDPGGAHEVAVTVQDINPFLQFPVAHQDHVADVGTGWRRGVGRGAVRGSIDTGGQRRPLVLHWPQQ